MKALTQQYCRYHPQRPGVGLCRACQATICEECSTRLEGVLHCKRCLEGSLEEVAPPTRWRSASALLPAALLLPVAYLAVFLALLGAALAIVGIGELSEWLKTYP